MKAYILSESDFTSLLSMIDRNPVHGSQGGSSDASAMADPEKRQAYLDAHRFYNYQIRTWIDLVKK